ncbi:MAG: hypothetical protein M1821_007131 [Bathelium mastoideum]|nr:MAG: hypothetical protein M1821_007131 [Bathelium mastoideum]
MTVSLLAIGFQFADMVLNARQIMTQETGSADNMIASATNITVTISICYLSLVFVLKLGYAIVERRKLGLKQFGPMQIIFIMGCQTLIVPGRFCPVIFCGIQYKANLIPQASSLVPTVVALFLPLSSLWASANIEDNMQARNNVNAHHKFPGKKGSASSGRRPLVEKFGSGLSKKSNAEKIASVSSPQPNPGFALGSQENDLEK